MFATKVGGPRTPGAGRASISSTATGGPYGDSGRTRTGRTTGGRFAALSFAGARTSRRERSQATGPTYVHAHDWQAATDARLFALRPAASGRDPRSMTDAQPGLPGRFYRRQCLPASWACRRRRWAVDGVEYYGGVGFLKAGPATAADLGDHHGEPTLTPQEIRDARLRHGARRAGFGCAPTIVDGIAQRHRRRSELEPAGRTRLSRRPTRSDRLKAAPSTNKRCRGSASASAQRRWPDLLRRQPAHLAEGHGHAAQRCSTTWSRNGGRLALLGLRVTRRWKACSSATALPATLVASGVRIGYDEALSHRMQGGARGDPDPIAASSPAALLAALWSALRLRAGGGADGRARGYDHRCQRVAALIKRCRDGRSIRRGSGDQSLATAIKRGLWRFTATVDTLGGRWQRNGMKSDVSWGRSAGALCRALSLARRDAGCLMTTERRSRQRRTRTRSPARQGSARRCRSSSSGTMLRTSSSRYSTPVPARAGVRPW